jgi:hypothetical protein
VPPSTIFTNVLNYRFANAMLACQLHGLKPRAEDDKTCSSQSFALGLSAPATDQQIFPRPWASRQSPVGSSSSQQASSALSRFARRLNNSASKALTNGGDSRIHGYSSAKFDVGTRFQKPGTMPRWLPRPSTGSHAERSDIIDRMAPSTGSVC